MTSWANDAALYSDFTYIDLIHMNKMMRIENYQFMLKCVPLLLFSRLFPSYFSFSHYLAICLAPQNSFSS